MNSQDITNDPCPNCGASHTVCLMSRAETVNVRGQNISVNASAYVCSDCDCVFHGPGASDATELAIQRFRQLKGLLLPEQLKAWRQSLKLKQSEVASLLGWSTATVSRYENGALQDDAHDRALRAAMTPQGLAALVGAANDLSQDVRERLGACAKHQAAGAEQLEKVVTSRIEEFAAPDLDWEKLAETVLFFCEGTGAWRPKLNKLLFYCDFLAAKYFDRTVTGLSYVRSMHGPVPQNYELIFATLQERGLLHTSEFADGLYVAYRHRALRQPEFSCFNDNELRVLIEVRSKFARTPIEDLQRLSNGEEASKRAVTGKPLPVALAKSLSIAL